MHMPLFAEVPAGVTSSACRCHVKLQAAAFLVAEALYVCLHLKPFEPLLLRGTGVDEPFLRDFTTGAYFASELALFCLLAFVSPIRSASAA